MLLALRGGAALLRRPFAFSCRIPRRISRPILTAPLSFDIIAAWVTKLSHTARELSPK